MKTSVEWLKEYTNVDVTTKDLADILTMTGTKVETIEEKGKEIQNVVVGKILTIEKHPDADKLVVTKVDIGEDIVQIVTGAKNIKVGDIIPVAKDGSSLPKGVKIKKGKLRGVDSCGMMCSIGELELSKEEYPEQIEDGIMILPKEYESKLGQDIVDVLDLREDILDFEITPNRPDCLSIEGLGRETAVSLKNEFKNPRKNLDKIEVENKKEIEGLRVDIKAPDLCYRYIARVVKNVKIGPSPKWMVRRLKACGIRSINNIVDITNYVMLELGEPMHAFDIESIEGKHIIVRRANKDEKITTLDGVERQLNDDILVISDEKKAVAIAGVMGGENSEIEKDTKTIVFEAAVFNRGSIRKASKQVGIRTESSSRFEKGLSTENALRAINRAVELVEELKIGEAIPEKIDVYPKKQQTISVTLNPDRINNLIGTNLTKEEMIKILEDLEMKVENDKVIPPYFRQDIEQEADIAEEVLRIYGYDKLDSTQVESSATIGLRTKIQKIEKDVRCMLINCGMQEIYTYGIISKKDLEKIGATNLFDSSIKIINPLSEDYTIMRQTTIPSMMETLASNDSKKNQDVKLFDISRTYVNENEKIENGNVPKEDKVITLGMYGKEVDFYTLKGIVENILQVSNIVRFDLKQEVENPSYHEGRCASVYIGIDKIATFGQIHPTIAQNYKMSKEIYVAEINLSKLEKYSKPAKKYTPIPKFPAVERDIAIVVDEDVTVGKIEEVITKQAKKLLEEVKLFDIYRDEKLGKNKKSVAYSLQFRDPNKTLTDEEINPLMEKIVQSLEKELNAKLRV